MTNPHRPPHEPPMVDARPSRAPRARRGVAARITALAAVGVLLAGCSGGPAADADPSASTGSADTTGSPEATGASDVAPEVAAAVDAMLDAGAVGVSVTVRDGDASSSIAAGVADLATGREAAVGDEVRIASISKTVLATVVLQLVEEGDLALDSTVESVLPGLLDAAPGDVTVEQLLAHTSGLPDPILTITPDAATALEVHDETFAPEQLVAIAQQQPWLAAPGSAFHYSNAGYTVLGLMAEAVTGETVPDLMRDRVLEPVGMDDTIYPTDDAMPDGAMHGYLTIDGEPVDSTPTSPSFWSFGAALTSTPDDVSAFLAALWRGELVSDESVALMQDVGVEGYGLGVLAAGDACGVAPPELVFGQRGNGFGYNAIALASPDGERVVTVAYTGGSFDPAADPIFPVANEVLVAGLASTCP